MKRGRLALVFYGMPEADAKAVAAGIDDVLTRASGSLVDLDVTAVPASPEAQEAFKVIAEATGRTKDNKDGACVDDENADTYLSRTADGIMEQLKDYDFVVGLLPVEFCVSLIGGSADPQRKGRHADLSYAGAQFWASLREGGTAADAAAEVIKRLSGDGAHEVGHLLRLAHAGFLEARNANGGYTSLETEAKNGNLDLVSYLKRCSYNSYGAGTYGDLMGNGTYKTVIVPNPIEQEVLRWPNIMIEGQTASFATSLGAEWSSISAGDAHTGKFMMTHLDRPVYFRGGDFVSNSEGAGARFDSLAVVARTNGAVVSGVELILFDTDTNMTTSFGYLGKSAGGTEKSWMLNYNSQTFEIRLTANGVQARLA